MTEKGLAPIELTNQTIESMIYEIRWPKVMLDFDLARVRRYTTKALNQQTNRNIDKFPERYCFQMTKDEDAWLRSKKLTPALWATGSGCGSYLPYAFTE